MSTRGPGRSRRTLVRSAVTGLCLLAAAPLPAAWAGGDSGEDPGADTPVAHGLPATGLAVQRLAGACPNVPYGQGGAGEEHRERGEAYFGTPPNPAGPTVVDVAVYIDEITEISPVDNTFKVEGFLDLVWCDPREAFDPAAAGAQQKVFLEAAAAHEVNRSWYPELTLVNEVEPRIVENEELSVLPDGTTEYREKFAAQLEAHYDFTHFPFDSQVLEMELESFTWHADQVRLQQRAQMVGFSDEFQIPDWRTEQVSAHVATVQEDRDRALFSEFIAEIEVTREFSFYLWKILLPLVLMVAVSWSVFWMSGESLSDRVGVTFTGLLTVVAYQFIMSDTLPKVVYFTFWDAVLTLSFVLMAATIAENVVVQAVATRTDPVAAARVDHTCRWLFPAAYAAGLAGLALLYLT